MRIKTPPQPLVFRLEGASALCGAVAELYRRWPEAPSCLCLWQGAYFLQVEARLSQRRQMNRVVQSFGCCLGPRPVLFAYCREHGREIGHNLISGLGKALNQGKKGAGDEENRKNCKE